MRFSVVFLALLAPLLLRGQTDRAEVYELALSSGKYDFDQLVDLAEDRLKTEEEIALFFYYWIGSHVAYDTQTTGLDFGSPVFSEYTDPISVFKNRKATCMGFTNLYRAFLNYFGIHHRTVVGYSRHRENLLKRAESIPDHTWSAIWIDDQWHVVETTWANLYIDDPTLRDFYFMTDPKEFSIDHLPLDNQWQLTGDPLNLEEFVTRPFLDPRYFSNAKNRDLYAEITLDGSNQYRFESSTLPGWKLSLVLVDNKNERVNRLKYKVSRTKPGISFLLKNYDPKYTLRLDAHKTLKDGTHLTMVGIAYANFEMPGKTSPLSYTSIGKPNRHR